MNEKSAIERIEEAGRVNLYALNKAFGTLVDRAHEESRKMVHEHISALACAESGAVLALIDELRARGVVMFEGLGFKLTLGDLTNTTAPAHPYEPKGDQPEEPKGVGVDMGDGLRVDPDLFGQEG